MKKKLLFTVTLAASFVLGFAFKSLISNVNGEQPFKKATSIGGIFFKCKNPKNIRAWYQKHLGLNTNDYGAVFEWRQGADTTKKGFTQWSPFNEKSKYFDPSTKDFMINYRVENLDALINQLRQDSVIILDTIETAEYGKFIHIMDIEGNKIELWEPNDIEYEKLGIKMGAATTK
jgi:predicted enzyme related to lactoylglutathione lyase